MEQVQRSAAKRRSRRGGGQPPAPTARGAPSPRTRRPTLPSRGRPPPLLIPPSLETFCRPQHRRRTAGAEAAGGGTHIPSGTDATASQPPPPQGGKSIASETRAPSGVAPRSGINRCATLHRGLPPRLPPLPSAARPAAGG